MTLKGSHRTGLGRELAQLRKEGGAEGRNRGAVKDLGRIVLEMLLIFIWSVTQPCGHGPAGCLLLVPVGSF